jgi:hypothetical protein
MKPARGGYDWHTEAMAARAVKMSSRDFRDACF